LISLGAGIIISAILMNSAYMAGLNFKIEEKARAMGMVYPEEVKVLGGEER